MYDNNGVPLSKSMPQSNENVKQPNTSSTEQTSTVNVLGTLTNKMARKQTASQLFAKLLGLSQLIPVTTEQIMQKQPPQMTGGAFVNILLAGPVSISPKDTITIRLPQHLWNEYPEVLKIFKQFTYENLGNDGKGGSIASIECSIENVVKKIIPVLKSVENDNDANQITTAIISGIDERQATIGSIGKVIGLASIALSIVVGISLLVLTALPPLVSIAISVIIPLVVKVFSFFNAASAMSNAKTVSDLGRITNEYVTELAQRTAAEQDKINNNALRNTDIIKANAEKENNSIEEKNKISQTNLKLKEENDNMTKSITESTNKIQEMEKLLKAKDAEKHTMELKIKELSEKTMKEESEAGQAGSELEKQAKMKNATTSQQSNIPEPKKKKAGSETKSSAIKNTTTARSKKPINNNPEMNLSSIKKEGGKLNKTF